VELIYLVLNSRFDMCIIFTANYSFSGRHNEPLLIDFVNLKIKPAQSFRSSHRSRMHICMFIGMSTHKYMSIYVYTVF
jgi:hypothetical protein